MLLERHGEIDIDIFYSILFASRNVLYVKWIKYSCSFSVIKYNYLCVILVHLLLQSGLKIQLFFQSLVQLFLQCDLKYKYSFSVA